jgi:tRNA U34 2-thiouridine synthase MnmA/TrmU
MESLTVCEFEIAELKWVRPPPKWKGLKVEVRWGARSSEKPPTAKILQFFGGVVHARFEEPQGLVQIGDEVTFLQGQEVLGVGRVRRLGTQDGFTSYDEVKAHDLHD